MKFLQSSHLSFIGILFSISLIYELFLKSLIKATLLRSRSMIKISHVLKLSSQNDKILSPDSIEKKDGRLFSYKIF